MKKRRLFFMISFLAFTLASWAQGDDANPSQGSHSWGVLDTSQWPSETVVYAKLDLGSGSDAMPNYQNYEVAAFVENASGEAVVAELRAVAEAEANPGVMTYADYNYFVLRVKGGDADMGSVIKFKLYNKSTGIEIDLSNEELQWDGEMVGTASDLFVLSAIEPTAISLPSPLTVKKGETLELLPLITVTPEEAAVPNNLTWEYSNSAAYISVTDNILNGLAPRNEAYLELNAGSLRAWTLVNVTNPATAITILDDHKVITVEKDDWETLTTQLNEAYELTPADATDQVKWVSGNTDIVRFADSNAAWNPIAGGETTMTAQIVDHEADGTEVVRLSSTLTVKVIVPVSDLTANYSTIHLNVGDNLTAFLGNLYTVSPSDATNKTLTYDVENNDPEDPALTIDQAGTVKAVKSGLAQLIAYADEAGLEATINVQVHNPAKDLTFEAETLNFQFLGEELDLAADIKDNLNFLPADFDGIDNLTFSSSNTDVLAISGSYGADAADVTVSATGKANGEATVTVRFTYTDYLAQQFGNAIGGTPLPDPTDGDIGGEIVAPDYDDVEDGGSGTSMVSTIYVTKTFKVVLSQGITGFDADFSKLESEGVITLTPQPEGADINFGDLDASFYTDALPEGWPFLEISDMGTDQDGKPFIIVNIVNPGAGTLNIKYGDLVLDPMPFEVGLPLELQEGWQWITPWSFIESGNLQEAFGDDLIEIRSQEYLLANDPVYGYFGKLLNEGLNRWEGYKVKMNAYKDNPYSQRGGSVTTGGETEAHVGWNWIGNPYLYDREISTVLTGTFNEGDRIVSKSDGFVEYADGQWQGSLYSLRKGEGYLFYNSGSESELVNYESEWEMEPENAAFIANAKSLSVSPWKYDAKAFRDNMSIVAAIDGLTDLSSYSVGAYVGDECRGEGTAVNGRFFITVHANTGEQISFRLYNRATGEFFQVPETMRMRQMAGSLKSPVTMTKGEATGIDAVTASALTGDSEVYTVGGVRTDAPQKGVNVVRSADGKTRKVVVK